MVVVRPGVLVPEQIEGVKDRLGTAEQQVTELRLAGSVEADDFAIEDTAPASQVES